LKEILIDKKIIVFMLPLIILIFYLTVLNHFNYTPDDSYIYFQFARNVSLGNGFAFNAHQPTYGVTSPLWTFIISLSGFFGTDYVLSAKVLDLFFASLSIIMFFLLVLQVLKDLTVSLLATLVLSMNAWFVRWSASGMETSLAVFLLLAVLYYCWRHEYLLAYFLSGLLFLTRPETFILPLLMSVDIILNTFTKKRTLKLVITCNLIFLAVITPWIIYAKNAFGSIIPNTALAKATLGVKPDDYFFTLKDLSLTLFVTDAVTIATILLSILALIFISLSRKREKAMMRKATIVAWLRGHFVPISWVVAIVFLDIVTQVNIVSRYMLLVIPILIIYAFSLLYSFIEIIGKSKYFYIVALLLTIFAIYQNQFVYNRYVKPSIFSFTKGMNDCFIPIAVWLKNNTSKDAVVFTPDIGAIGYYSGRKICDGAGLISPEILKYLRQGLTYNDIMNNRIYNLACSPDYVVDRNDYPNALKEQFLKPEIYKPVFGLGISNMKTVYYTVYKNEKMRN
jgi:hypothetical protein